MKKKPNSLNFCLPQIVIWNRYSPQANALQKILITLWLVPLSPKLVRSRTTTGESNLAEIVNRISDYTRLIGFRFLLSFSFLLLFRSHSLSLLSFCLFACLSVCFCRSPPPPPPPFSLCISSPVCSVLSIIFLPFSYSVLLSSSPFSFPPFSVSLIRYFCLSVSVCLSIYPV